MNGLNPIPIDDLLISTIEAKTQGDQWPKPRQLDNSLPSVMPFEYELLPQIFRDYVQAAAASKQSPPDYIAIPLICSIGAVIGSRLTIKPEKNNYWQEAPNLWGMIIGRPSSMKSPSMSDGLLGIKSLETKANETNAQKLTEYAKAKRAYEIKKKAAEKLTTKELEKSLDADVSRFDIEPPENPIETRFYVNDATYEKVGEILSGNPRGLLVVRDELMGFLKPLQKEENAAARGFYLEAWNGTGSYKFDRISRNCKLINPCCISMIGGTQPAKIQPFVKDAVFGGSGDDGLLQRFSLAVWPDQSKTWIRCNDYPLKADKDNVLAIFDYIDEFDPFNIGAVQNGGLPYLEFSNEAQEIFDDYRNKLENELRSNSFHHAIEAHFGKYRKLVPALALIFSMVMKERGAVSKEALELALKWETYLKTHALRLYSAATMPEKDAALALFNRIRCGSLKDAFTIKEVQTKNWTGLNDNSIIKAGVQVLLDHEIIIEAIKEQSIGRPSDKYLINPRFKELLNL